MPTVTPQTRPLLPLIFSVLFFFTLLNWTPLSVLAQSNLSLEKGQKIFRNYCGRCHGLEGGGGTGPSLQRPTLVRAPDDGRLAAIIQYGIPGTGMPGSWMLSPEDVRHLVTFVRQLGKTGQQPISGDVAKGKILYSEKGACYTCHIIAGKGNSLGPELTDVGLRRGPEYLREAIQHPGKESPLDSRGFVTYLVVEVTLKDGRSIRGVRINEDTFTLQIRDANNRIHSFRKRDLQSHRSFHDESLMPSFQQTFSPKELDHLVAFLASLNKPQP